MRGRSLGGTDVRSLGKGPVGSKEAELSVCKSSIICLIEADEGLSQSDLIFSKERRVGVGLLEELGLRI